MITILRKHHRWLMIVIAILAVPFVFYFNKTDFGAQRSTDLGRIYDRPVTQVEFSRNARLMNLANSLGLSLGTDLMIVNVASENEMYAEFTWNRLILRHEAEQLGIRPNSSEITAFVKTLPHFKGDAGFDINKYTEFTKTMLPALGFNESHIEELVSDQLSLNRVKELLGTGMQVSESESMENYEKAYGKMDAAVVRLRDEDFEKDVKITDEDIAKYYEAHKAQLKSEEKRRVEFATFALTEEEKKLTGKERVDPLQKVADRANDFTQALLEKDANFGEIASKFQSPVAATGEFTAAAPDPQLAANPQLAQYSFQLTQQTPFSDPIQGPDGFYVLHLLGLTEAHPLSLEEAKPKIVETLKSERLRELVSNKGAEVARQLREALKSATPLEKAAQQSGLKLERMLPFSLVETPAPKPETDKERPKNETPKNEKPGDEKPKVEKPGVEKPGVEKPGVEKPKVEKPKDEKPKVEKPGVEKPKDETPELPTIKNAVADLNPGEVTDFVPAGKGGLVAVLEKRAPADPSGYASAKAQFESRYLLQRRGAVFVEWMRDRRRAAGVSVATS
jgi:SurA N-terminal domain/PPIC-type PPIASE domain